MQAGGSEIHSQDGDRLTSLLDEYRGLVVAPSSHPSSIDNGVEAYKALKAYLTAMSQQLAKNGLEREICMTSGLFAKIVESLCTFYPLFDDVQRARPAPAEEEQRQTKLQGGISIDDGKEQQQDPYYRASQVAMLLMRALRNGMAGCAEAQSLLCRRFDRLSPFLVNLTRFHTLNDPDTHLLCRAAAQMLSNLITANQDVQRHMWSRLVTAERDDDRLVLKLLSSPDTATQSAAQILLINFIRTPEWAEDAQVRCYELCTSPAGLQLIESLLSVSDSIMIRTASTAQDDMGEEYEPESEIEGLEESLGFIYTIFATLFESGYSSLLVSALAPMERISSTSWSSKQSDLPIISSSQLTLLKLLDSWLHVNQKQVAEASSSSSPIGSTAPTFSADLAEIARVPGGSATKSLGLAGLVDVLMSLSAFAREAMSSGIARDGKSADQQPQDRRLIGVHRGLLLILQSLLSISLTADGWSEKVSASNNQSFATVSRALLSDMRSNIAFIDELVALLDQTHQYAPALSPFRPPETNDAAKNVTASTQEHTKDRPLPQGHALSSTGKAAHEGKEAQPSYGFDHLKRDIVRVLGSLVYAPTNGAPVHADPEGIDNASGLLQASGPTVTNTTNQIRQVQDRIREKGGLFHVLNMTVLDERNPYMREHAIFALRYLLAGNAESQSLVSSLQPTQSNDTSGGMQLPMV